MVPIRHPGQETTQANFYRTWHPEEHLTAFGMRLNDKQLSLVQSDVAITNDDKLQFFIKQMYKSNTFDKMEMMTWENQPTATKTDFDLARE